MPSLQCCGTVTIFYDSGSDLWKVTVDKLRLRFRLLIKTIKSAALKKFLKNLAFFHSKLFTKKILISFFKLIVKCECVNFYDSIYLLFRFRVCNTASLKYFENVLKQIIKCAIFLCRTRICTTTWSRACSRRCTATTRSSAASCSCSSGECPRPHSRELHSGHRVFMSVLDPDPHVFGPPGSGSISQRHVSGSGSSHHQAKIGRKPYLLWLLLAFLSLKNDGMYVLSKRRVISLEGQWRK